MSRIQHLHALALTLCLLGTVQSALAFSVKGSVRFDTETQQFYLILDLPECDYSPNRPSGIQRGNLTQYIAIPGVDRYAAGRRWEYGQEVVVRGTFRAQTTYAITVDGAICQTTGAGTTTVA